MGRRQPGLLPLTVLITAVLLAVPARAQQPSPSASPSPSPTASASPSPSFTAPSPTSTPSPDEPVGAPSLNVRTGTSSLLTQVGSTLRYRVTIGNSGDGAATDVTVLDLVPAEVRVLSVDLLDEVEAVQIGSTGGRDDIVWVVGELGAGQSLDLTWTGRATKLGDMAAANSAVVTAEGDLSASDDHRSFLASSATGAATNPEFEPIVKGRIIFRSAPSQDGGAATGVLPFTGIDEWIYAGIGVALITLGVVLIWFSRLHRSRRAGAVCIGVLLLLSACTSGDSDDTKPEVKGTRLERGDEAGQEEEGAETDTQQPQNEADQGATEQPVDRAERPPAAEDVIAALPDPLPPVPPAPPTRETETVTIGIDDLPVTLLDDSEGDNAISYQWDDSAREIPFATSSLMFVPGHTVELLSEVSDSGGGIEVHLRLRNTAERERLAVQGRLVHEIFGSQGQIARLVSDPIDVVLDPGGEIDVRFFYRLPSGDYRTASSFEAN